MKREQFAELFSKGSNIKETHIVLYYSIGEGNIGFATSKAIGSHPKRNRIKRRLKELVRKHHFPEGLKFNLVLLARKNAFQASFSQLNSELLHLKQVLNHIDG